MDKPDMTIPRGVNPRKSDYTSFMFRGDCLEHLKVLDNASVDMILRDLPYGVTHNPHDKRLPFEPLWKEYERVIKDNGEIVLFAQGLFYQLPTGIKTREFGVTQAHS